MTDGQLTDTRLSATSASGLSLRSPARAAGSKKARRPYNINSLAMMRRRQAGHTESGGRRLGPVGGGHPSAVGHADSTLQPASTDGNKVRREHVAHVDLPRS